MAKMSFKGKVVIVTGASSGIGASTALTFAKTGANLAIVGRNEAKLAKVQEKCKHFGNDVLVVVADISIERDAERVVKETAAKFGRIDVLVNNAGISDRAVLGSKNALEVFDRIMNTNLRSVMHLTNLSVEHLAATKGNIVNVSSVAGSVPYPAMSAYNTSKAGLDHLTRCTAVDLAPRGIRANIVSPGPVRTGILETSGFAPKDYGDAAWDAFATTTLLKKVSEAEEIADVIFFLASDKAGSITGANLFADNGMSLHRQSLV